MLNKPGKPNISKSTVGAGGGQNKGTIPKPPGALEEAYGRFKEAVKVPVAATPSTMGPSTTGPTAPVPTAPVMISEANKGWNAVELFRSGARVSVGRAHPKMSGTRTLKNIVPYVGTKSLLLQFLHVGVSLPFMTYQVDLMFADVEFSNDQSIINERDWMEIKYKNLQVYMKKIDLTKNRIRIRCSCPDFYFTFSYYDQKKGALFGSQPKRYVRKTIYRPNNPPGQRGYPPRNPGEYPGMCKHAANSIELAQQNSWILPYPRLF